MCVLKKVCLVRLGMKKNRMMKHSVCEAFFRKKAKGLKGFVMPAPNTRIG
mgnify:CR=1 FL=1